MTYSEKKEPLLNKIHEFQKIKNWIIVPLIALGLIGILLPVLPGLALLFAGIMLWKPEVAEDIRGRIDQLIARVRN